MAVAAIFAPAAAADLSGDGFRYLQPPCCGGDPLNGTRAGIRVSSVAPDRGHCLLFSSSAQNQAKSWLIQAGLVKCGPDANLDGTCSTSQNLVTFVEVESGLNNYACFQHQQAFLGQIYKATVLQPIANSDRWDSFIDGVAYEHNGFVQYQIAERAEHTSHQVCTGWSGFVTFGEGTAWQRWIKSTGTWFTVQSSYTYSPSCWVDGGSPPSTFYFSH